MHGYQLRSTISVNRLGLFACIDQGHSAAEISTLGRVCKFTRSGLWMEEQPGFSLKIWGWGQRSTRDGRSVECENGLGWDVCHSKSIGVASNPTSSAGEDGWLSCETQEVGYLINHPRIPPKQS
jgi:hypothetical protein